VDRVTGGEDGEVITTDNPVDHPNPDNEKPEEIIDEI